VNETAFGFLIRHGEAAMPDEVGGYGRSTAPLTARGREQAKRFADDVSALQIDAVFSSTVLRARETAAIIAEQLWLTPTVLEDLHEIDIGAFEGATLDQLSASHPEFLPWIECSFFGRFPSTAFHHPADLRFPDGESVLAMHNRALPAFIRLVQAQLGSTFVFVGHAWLNQALLCHITGSPVENFYRFAGPNASLSLVEVDDEARGILHVLNATEDLGAVAGGRIRGRGPRNERGMPSASQGPDGARESR
jgi:broad specificity phosphatase PhoE